MYDMHEYDKRKNRMEKDEIGMNRGVVNKDWCCIVHFYRVIAVK